jgi:hypothetical protein
MSTRNRWLVELSIAELEGQTRADGRLVMTDGACWMGHGGARRHPRDPDVAEIGEKIAAARALSDLAHLLAGSAAAELEALTDEQARVDLAVPAAPPHPPETAR